MGDFKNNGREWQPKGTPECTLVHDFPQDAKGKAVPYGCPMTWRATKHTLTSDNLATHHNLQWHPSDIGGIQWASMPIPTHTRSLSRQMQGEAMDTVLVLGSTNFNCLLMMPISAFALATFLREPASGTRLNTACSVTSLKIGEANRFVHSKPSLNSLQTPEPGPVSASKPNSTKEHTKRVLW